MTDILDLSGLATEVTRFTISVDREAEFDNTVDFYKVDANGNVTDTDGKTIAPDEDGYADAAIANRLGLDLATENRETSEFNAEFESKGDAFYAPIIAVNGDFDLFSDSDPTNDPTVYFTYKATNVDGFDHVISLENGQFSFEDLPDGGDKDFNDIILNFEVIEAIAEKPIGDVLDLSGLATEVTRFTISVDREAGFDNTVDFYKVDANGNVTDTDGKTIAPDEDGYADAAIANRLGLDLATENRETSEFNAEFESKGDAFYAPIIAVNGDFDLFSDSDPTNDPTVYFTYKATNVDGFDHVISLENGQFSFEDLPDGGDKDFNDIILNFEVIEELDETDGYIFEGLAASTYTVSETVPDGSTQSTSEEFAIEFTITLGDGETVEDVDFSNISDVALAMLDVELDI